MKLNVCILFDQILTRQSNCKLKLELYLKSHFYERGGRRGEICQKVPKVSKNNLPKTPISMICGNTTLPWDSIFTDAQVIGIS